MKPPRIYHEIRIGRERIAEDLVDFPLLLEWVLGDTCNVEDLVFLAEDRTTELPHCIRTFDSNSRLKSAWVRVQSYRPEFAHNCSSAAARRVPLTATYVSAEVISYRDAEHRIVKCSGEDVKDYWRPQSRPEGPDLLG